MSKVRKFSEDVEKTRTIEFVFSDETRDSYGTVFSADGWDLSRFNANGIILYQHNSWSDDPDVVIGSGRAWIENKQLLGSITFESAEINPLAEKVFRKYLTGTLKGCSIRFFPLKCGRWGDGAESVEGENPTYYIGKRELIEVSCVPIPSNKNALVRSLGKEMDEKPAQDEGFFAFGTVRGFEEVEEIPTPTPTPEQSEDNTTDEAFARTYINAVSALADI